MTTTEQTQAERDAEIGRLMRELAELEKEKGPEIMASVSRNMAYIEEQRRMEEGCHQRYFPSPRVQRALSRVPWL